MALINKITLGTAAIGGVWGKVDPVMSVNTVLYALENGITAIDTAPAYNEAETYVGQALKLWSGAKPFISTKTGRLKSNNATDSRYDYSVTAMEQSIRNSMDTLGISAPDLVLLHDPGAIPPSQVEESIEALLLFKAKGLTGQTGLGGNYPDVFRRYVTKQHFDAVITYNRCDACNLDAVYDTIPFCQQQAIAFFAASPLHMGLLGKRFPDFQQAPPSWVTPRELAIAVRLHTIALQHHLSLATLSMRFLFGVPGISRIIIGPANKEELQAILRDVDAGPLPSALSHQIYHIITSE